MYVPQLFLRFSLLLSFKLEFMCLRVLGEFSCYAHYSLDDFFSTSESWGKYFVWVLPFCNWFPQNFQFQPHFSTHWMFFIGDTPRDLFINSVLLMNKISCLSALLQLHLHSRLNTRLQWIGQRQLKDETRIIYFGGFGVTYIIDFTVTSVRNQECNCMAQWPLSVVTEVPTGDKTTWSMTNCIHDYTEVYNQFGPLLLTWINFNTRMDTYPFPNLKCCNFETYELISNGQYISDAHMSLSLSLCVSIMWTICR